MIYDAQNRQFQLLSVIYMYCFINYPTTLQRQALAKIKQNISTHMNLYKEAYHFCKKNFLIFLSQTAQHYSKIPPAYEMVISHQRNGRAQIQSELLFHHHTTSLWDYWLDHSTTHMSNILAQEHCLPPSFPVAKLSSALSVECT